VTTLVLPHDGASAGAARRALARELGQQDVPEAAVDDALLVVSELVGNAVRHGAPLPGGGISVSWRVLGGAVHVEVRDGGAGVPAARRGGRGLPILDLLSARWGTTAPGSRGGASVYAVLPLDAADPRSRGARAAYGTTGRPHLVERRSARPVPWPQHLERRASA